MEEFDILEEKIGSLLEEFKRLKAEKGEEKELREENKRLKEQIGLIKERLIRLIKRLSDYEQSE